MTHLTQQPLNSTSQPSDWRLDGQAALHLPAGVLEVWRVDLGLIPDAATDVLSPDERLRADAIVRSEVERRWRRSRAALRLLVGRYLGLEPAHVRFRTAPGGKLHLADDRLAFNGSHSGELALFAFAASGHVGVDVELADRPRVPDRGALAARVLGEPAAARIARVPAPEADAELLRMWVSHEARLKCLGVGLAGAGAERRREHEEPVVRELDLGPTAFAAVASAPTPLELRCRSLRRPGGSDWR